MPPKVSGADERLMSAYREAALRLNRILSQAGTARRTVVLRQVDALLAELDELTAKYIQAEIPAHFREGSADAVRELRKVAGFDVDATFATVHREAVQALADDAAMNLADRRLYQS